MAQPAKPQYTSDDLDHAHRAALEITQQSTVVQGCVTSLIFSRQLFDATQALLEAEIRDAWEIPNPELVIHTRMAAAHNKGMQLVSAAVLHRTCIETILPFTDSLVQIQQAAQSGGDGAAETQGPVHVESTSTRPDTVAAGASVSGESAGAE